MAFATQVKRRRGTTAENDAFTGAEGEIVVDTEKHELRVHDGVTQGGFIIGSGGVFSNTFNISSNSSISILKLPVGVSANPSEYYFYLYHKNNVDWRLNMKVVAYDTRCRIYLNGDSSILDSVKIWSVTVGNDFYILMRGSSYTPFQLGDIYYAGKYFYIDTTTFASETAPKNADVVEVPYILNSYVNKEYTSNKEIISIRQGAARLMVQAVSNADNPVRLNIWNGSTKLVGISTDGTVEVITPDANSNNKQATNTEWCMGHGILVASQMPSAANNYTWFRKYSDGYVEQGGLALSSTVTYPVPLSSWSYPEYNSLYNNTGPAPYFDIGQITSQTGTGFNKGGDTKNFVWRIVGMAAN